MDRAKVQLSGIFLQTEMLLFLFTATQDWRVFSESFLFVTG